MFEFFYNKAEHNLLSLLSKLIGSGDKCIMCESEKDSKVESFGSDSLNVSSISEVIVDFAENKDGRGCIRVLILNDKGKISSFHLH